MKRRCLVLALGLVLALTAVSGCSRTDGDDPPGNGGQGPDPEPGIQLTLYFRNEAFEPGVSPSDELLLGVTRVLPATTAVARTAAELLIAGPTAEERVAGAREVIRPDASLRDLILADGLLVVSLDYEDPFHPMLSLHHEDLAFVQAFVTTLTEFENVDAVWVLRDGQLWQGATSGWCSPLARWGEPMVFTTYYGDAEAAAEGRRGDWGYVRPVEVVIESPPSTIWENCPFALILDKLTRDHGGWMAPLPADNVLADVGLQFDLESGVMTVNLLGSYTIGHQASRILVEALVFTFTEIPVVDAVLVTLNGDPWHDSHFMWEEPITREELLEGSD